MGFLELELWLPVYHRGKGRGVRNKFININVESFINISFVREIRCNVVLINKFCVRNTIGGGGGIPFVVKGILSF